MTTCANCPTEAVYEYSVTKSLKIHYCVAHLPRFLKGKKDASLKVKLIEKPAPKKSTAKKKQVEESTDGAN